MKIVITIPTMGNRGGGLPPVVSAHDKELCSIGNKVHVCSFDEFTQPIFATLPGVRAWQYTPGFKKKIEELSPDIIHAHGIWMYHDFASWRYACKAHVPLIVSPHGMLDPWAVNNSKWKKKLIGFLFENRILKSAACIHALNQSEYESIRSYGLKNPVAIIPNGTDVPDHFEKIPHSGKRRLLFLGRLHPKKGIPALLAAWGSLKKQSLLHDWQLIVAGWDQNGHYQELQTSCRKNDLVFSEEFEDGKTIYSDSDVVFTGAKYGTGKEYLLKSSDAFILPSKSEGLPVAVLEAWAHGLPCILTPECNLPEGFSANAAVRIEPEEEFIEVGLKDFIRMSEAEQKQIGNNGLNLVKEKFSWNVIGIQLQQMYQWCLDGKDAPSYLRIN